MPMTSARTCPSPGPRNTVCCAVAAVVTHTSAVHAKRNARSTELLCGLLADAGEARLGVVEGNRHRNRARNDAAHRRRIDSAQPAVALVARRSHKATVLIGGGQIGGKQARLPCPVDQTLDLELG